MTEPVGFSREYWRKDNAACILTVVDGVLEVSVVDDEGGLVALWPCRDYFEAFDMAHEWRTNPPARWPDERCLD
jgi:hypothetical protein